MHWVTSADLERFEGRLFAHIDERFTIMTDAFSQALADLDAEVTAIGTEMQSLLSQVASGGLSVQAAHDQVEQRVAALKALLPTPPAPPAPTG